MAQFETELRKLVEAHIETLVTHMAAGSAPDFVTYRESCGQIAGLRSALEFCDEAAEIVKRQS